jgi:4-hydroxybenzoate polyprenyltransferase
MPASQAARQEAPLPPRFATSTVVPPDAFAADRSGALGALTWAVYASTWHRIRRGEGALLAINFSLILAHGAAFTARGGWQALVSVLAILVMYAFNDLYDAPVDWKNPKKDRALIAAWLEHRWTGVLATMSLKIVTLAVAFATLGVGAAAAVAAVMIVNVVYSTRLKGVPVADVVAVFVWGALYAAIVGAAPALVFLVGLMTGICHLFQALDDRTPDAANGIQTTAVRSADLSRNVLSALSLLLVGSLYGLLGPVAALTGVVPLAIFFAIPDAGTGWLFTKGYFAVVWLAVLGASGAGI